MLTGYIGKEPEGRQRVCTEVWGSGGVRTRGGCSQDVLRRCMKLSKHEKVWKTMHGVQAPQVGGVLGWRELTEAGPCVC